MVSVPYFRPSFYRGPEISSLPPVPAGPSHLPLVLFRIDAWDECSVGDGWSELSFMGTATGMGQKEERAAQVVLGNLILEDIKRAKK